MVPLLTQNSMSNSSADQFFAPGSILTLLLTIDQAVFECNASILKIFIPFTKSQVLLVELQPRISRIPSLIILKVYDPRFIKDCEPTSSGFTPGHPWSLSLEIAAAEHRKAFACRECFDYVDFEGVYWENGFYGFTEDAFDSELAAYSCLQDLQGVSIPRCYASGNLAVDLLRPISPHVLVLEYIPGETFSTITPSSVPRLLARSLITTVCSFASHGVIHCDLRKDNIIFSQQPSRVVVIDFGELKLCKNESDSKWESAVTKKGGEAHMKQSSGIWGPTYSNPQNRANVWLC